MSLLTLVKAGNITNLSDARYCAAMGVEIMGFPLGKSNSLALDTLKIKELIGWLSGIKISLEIKDGYFDSSELLDAIEVLKPDFLQLPISLVAEVRKLTTIPFIVESTTLITFLSDNDYLLFSGKIELSNEALVTYCKSNKVLLSAQSIEASTLLTIIKAINPSGIELKGGNEIRPGLKSFDELAELFELLDVE